ncbi:hypothetical protein BESB_013900 [Besnoitia besnoiti]|uniref:CUE domain-containing protein n=1 Tax=Besnoitia besnoiti TaxID=94643 RepID=A0A2A9M2R5_BESBE|nr:hypothetical protein BESB_013900 [Besnoitia besnoiti]PFH32778.1 hypothetical protein BESB_013900 [Besnoitia besnoiti]
MADGTREKASDTPCEISASLSQVRPAEDKGSKGLYRGGLHAPGSELPGSDDRLRSSVVGSLCGGMSSLESHETSLKASAATPRSDLQSTSSGSVPSPRLFPADKAVAPELTRQHDALGVRSMRAGRGATDGNWHERSQLDLGESPSGEPGLSHVPALHQKTEEEEARHLQQEQQVRLLMDKLQLQEKGEPEQGAGPPGLSGKAAQLAKRCKRSSVLCCRCRQTPVPSAEPGGRSLSGAAESASALKQATGGCDGEGSNQMEVTAAPSMPCEEHDCCSCCYCSCGKNGNGDGSPSRKSFGGGLDAKQTSDASARDSFAPMPHMWRRRQSSGRIICIEGPSRPETFERNLRELSEEFPCIHQGLIISLLETAENNLSHARQLVQVVSDTTLSSGAGAAPRRQDSLECEAEDSELGRQGIGGCFLSEAGTAFASTPESVEWVQALSWRPASRKRQIEGEDAEHSSDLHSSRVDASATFPRPAGAATFCQAEGVRAASPPLPAPSGAACKSLSSRRPPASACRTDTTHGASSEPPRSSRRRSWSGRDAPPGRDESAASFGAAGGVGISVELWSSEWAQRMLRVIYGATSAEDAKTNVATLMQEQTEQLLNIHAGAVSLSFARPRAEEGLDAGTPRGPSATRRGLNGAAQSQERHDEMEKKLELLQNDKVLLARAVKTQHERIQSLQASLSEKTEELERVSGEKRALEQDLRKMKDAAAAVLLGRSLRGGNLCRDSNNSFDRS